MSIPQANGSKLDASYLRVQAKIGGEVFDGRLRWSEVTSDNEPREYESAVQVGDTGPQEGTEAQMTLVGLLGPLRVEAALEAEGRLTQQLWTRLIEFREEFAKLQLELE